MKICPRPRHLGAVLACVKAKPFGWPAASPDPGSGRHPLAVIESSRQIQDQIQLRGVSTVRGDCRKNPGFALGYRASRFSVGLRITRVRQVIFTGPLYHDFHMGYYLLEYALVAYVGNMPVWRA